MSSSDEELHSFFDDLSDLPPILESAHLFIQNTNEGSMEELNEKHKSLSNELFLQRSVQQDVKEEFPTPSVNDIDTELDNVSIEGDLNENDHEAPINIFIRPNNVQYFSQKNITLNNCGYESVTELSNIERCLLTLESKEIHNVIGDVLACGKVQNVNPFVHFVMKSMCVSSDDVFVVSSTSLLIDLLTKSDLEDIKFSSGDIFQILFNCSADVMQSEVFNILPPEGRTKPNPCMSEEPIPENWELNLKSVLICVNKILKGCTISEEDLCLAVIYFLMMSSDVELMIYSELQQCLITALSRFPPGSWPVYRSNITITVATFSEIIPLDRQWFYIYSMVKSIPFCSSNGAELRKYISVLVLLKLVDDAGTLGYSLEYSEELFSLSKLMTILSSLSVKHTTFQHVIIKFLDILVNHLKFSTEEYEQLCKLLKSTEANFMISSNLVHLKIIHTRINLSKLSHRRLKTLGGNCTGLQDSKPGGQQDTDIGDTDTLHDTTQGKTDLQESCQHFLTSPKTVGNDGLKDSNQGDQQDIDIEDSKTPQGNTDLQASCQQFSKSLKIGNDGLQDSNTRDQQSIDIEDRNIQHGTKEGNTDIQISCQQFSTSLKTLANVCTGLQDADSGDQQNINIEDKNTLQDTPQGNIDLQASCQQFSTNIRERLDHMLTVRDGLHITWTNKSLHIHQALSFLKLAEELDKISNQQEVDLSSSISGHTVAEAHHNLEMHNAFENSLETQKKKLLELQKFGDMLLLQKHFNSEIIKKKVLEVFNRRSQVEHLSDLRKQELTDNYLHALFKREASEAELWIKEKKKYIEAEQDMSRITSLEYKKIKLQNYQDFHAEISAYSRNIQDIKQKGKELSKNPNVSNEIEQQLTILENQFNELITSENVLSCHFKKISEILEFNKETKEIEAWIEDTANMVQAGDTAKDFEHCQALLRKLDNMSLEIAVDTRKENIDCLASELKKQELPGMQYVQLKQEELNMRWKSLQEELNQYHRKVANALDVYSFYRDVDTTNDKINEHLLALSVYEETKDLESAESCKRKLEIIKNNMPTIETKLKEMVAAAHRLVQKNPEIDPQISMKLSEVRENWKRLTNFCISREQSISSAHIFHTFILEVKNLESSVSDITAQIMSEIASITSKFQSLLYHEQEPGINERQESIKNLEEFVHCLLQKKQASNEVIERKLQHLKEFIDVGKKIMELGHYAQDKVRFFQIKERLDQLLAVQVVLHTRRTDKNLYLDHLCVLQNFLKVADELDRISSQQELHLSSSVRGNKVEELQHQITKHDDFEKLFETQNIKLIELRNYENELLLLKHFDCQIVKKSVLELTKRRSQVKQLSDLRKQILTDNYLCALFKEEASEAELWIEEKKNNFSTDKNMSQVCSIGNNEVKRQRYQALQTEVTTKKSCIQNIEKDGEKLILRNPPNSDEIRQQLTTLKNKYNNLVALSKTVLAFINQTEKIEAWIRNTENIVQAGATGKDFEDCQALQRMLIKMKIEMTVESDRIKWVDSLANKLENQGMSMQFVQQGLKELKTKWKAIQDALNLYCQKVDDASKVYSFNRDVDSTNDQINEKLVALSACEENKDLQSVESNQRKLEAIKNDMSAIKTKLEELDIEAQSFIQKNSEVNPQAKTKLSEVHENWKKLTDLCLSREESLSSDHAFQTFLLNCADLESRTAELLIKNSDSQNMLQIHKEQETELKEKQESIKKLKCSGHHLLQQKYASEEIIKAKLQQLEEFAKNLAQVCDIRQQGLTLSSDPYLHDEKYIQSDDVVPKDKNYYDFDYIYNDHSCSNSPISNPSPFFESVSKTKEIPVDCSLESIVEIEDCFIESPAPLKPKTLTRNNLSQPTENSQNSCVEGQSSKEIDDASIPETSTNGNLPPPNVIKVIVESNNPVFSTGICSKISSSKEISEFLPVSPPLPPLAHTFAEITNSQETDTHSPSPEPITSPTPDIVLSHNTQKTLPTTSKRQLETTESDTVPEKRLRRTNHSFNLLTELSKVLNTNTSKVNASTSREQIKAPSQKMISRYIKKVGKTKKSSRNDVPVVRIDSDSDDECQIVSVVKKKKKPVTILLD